MISCRMDPPSLRPRLDVATPVFEGPLELLLALAERDELDIFQVRLSDLTDAYLVALAAMDRRDPHEMAEFLWLATRLLLLKSIRLLPGEEPEPDEADLLGWEEDVRRRLQEYRAYREMAESLMARAAEDPFTFSPPAREVEALGQEQPLRLDALVIAFQSLLARVPPRPLVYIGRAWTLDEKLGAVEARLEGGRFDLVALILDSEDRLEAVVTFVAVLELLRQGRIQVRQGEAFGQVWVEARTPR